MTNAAEIAAIDEMLSGLRPAAPLTHGALTLVPLLAPHRPEPDWLTFAEAGEAVIVTEVSQGGSVPELALENTADHAVLLLDGEQLIGAKQNRILNTTVLVAARSTVRIPVSCVEQGRWGYRSPRMVSSDVVLFASARARNAAHVSAALRSEGRHTSDQGQIWHDVAAKLTAHNINSPTRAMHDFIQDVEQDLGVARTALAPRPGQVGAIAFVADKWLGLDLLAAPRLFARCWPRLSTSYAVEAVRLDPERAPAAAPESSAILSRLARLAAEHAPAVGLGTEFRLFGSRTHGAALVVDERVAHLMAFPELA